MNEFIVWDRDKKIFRYSEYRMSNEGRVTDYNGRGGNYEPLPYIGKKDIESNKIYAESSIVEFETWEPLKALHELGICPTEFLKGYFKYNNEYSRYEIIPLVQESKRTRYVINKSIKNLKIIDTIQENKLGLIK